MFLMGVYWMSCSRAICSGRNSAATAWPRDTSPLSLRLSDDFDEENLPLPDVMFVVGPEKVYGSAPSECSPTWQLPGGGW